MTTETQTAAHEAIKPVKVSLQNIVLETIRGFGSDGATSDQVVEAMASLTYGQNAITTRYKELAAKGKICYGLNNRPGKSGRAQKVMKHSDYCQFAAPAVVETLDIITK